MESFSADSFHSYLRIVVPISISEKGCSSTSEISVQFTNVPFVLSMSSRRIESPERLISQCLRDARESSRRMSASRPRPIMDLPSGIGIIRRCSGGYTIVSTG